MNVQIIKGRGVWRVEEGGQYEAIRFVIGGPGLLLHYTPPSTNKGVRILEISLFSRLPESHNILNLGFASGSGTHTSKNPISHRLYSPGWGKLSKKALKKKNTA